jgi:phosphatidylglycerophosphatase A
MTSTNIARLFCSVFGLGFSPKAPGTVGSLAGLGIWYILTLYLDSYLLGFIFSATTILGLLATSLIIKSDPQVSDPQFIVIDEVVGVWLAAFTLTPTSGWPAWLAAFLLFRFFDIKKPWLVSKAESLPGEVGVMADDIVAGFFSMIIIIAFQLFFIL